MKTNEYLNSINNMKIDNSKVSIIEKTYAPISSDEVKKIISNCDDTLFINDVRLLTFAEISDAEDELEIAFAEQKILPLFDCGDNDFIVYNLNEYNWSLYNIIDNCIFKTRSSLEELL